MSISEYWVGQIPHQPLQVAVHDSYGNRLNLAVYDSIQVKMLDSDNSPVDTSGITLDFADDGTSGDVTIIWPKDKSLFNKRGDAVMQLQCNRADGSVDFTTSHTLRIRELGKVR